MLFYISDLHLSHANIINTCNRPYDNIEDMNKLLIDNWNKVITNDDIVYFLGDFSFKCNQEQATKFLLQLKGKKYFIKGNHDKTTWLNKLKEQRLIEDWYDYKEINDNGRMVILCHYPLHSWNGLYHGSYHLYGHVHNNTVENAEWQKNRFNVSCEAIDYKPITLDELIKISEKDDSHKLVNNKCFNSRDDIRKIFKGK